MADDLLRCRFQIEISAQEHEWFIAHFERQVEQDKPPIYSWDVDQEKGRNVLVIDIEEYRSVGVEALAQVAVLVQNMIQMWRDAPGMAPHAPQEEDNAGSARPGEGVVRTDN